jgi:hypothetical protein
LQALPHHTLQLWVKEIILPIIKRQQQDKPSEGGGWLSWIYGSGEESEDDPDNLDQFFDCQDETAASTKDTRERTSLDVIFEVKELTLLLAKLQQ